MLIEPVVRRLELSVGSAVNRVTGNLLAGVPLLIGVGFATAAGDYYAVFWLGPVVGNLVVAGVFIILSALIYAVQRSRNERIAQQAAARLAAIEDRSPVDALLNAAQLPQLQQMLLDSAKNAVPQLAQAALREAPKNLPLLIGAGVGLLVAQRIVDAVSHRHEA